MKITNVKWFVTVLIGILMLFAGNLKAQPSVKSQDGWTDYMGGSVYSISVPSTVELRDARDAYSKTLRRLNLLYNFGTIVFQQKGLALQDQNALNKYCRIMIQYTRGENEEFLKSSETEVLDKDWRDAFDELVTNNIGPYSRLIGNYTYKWVTINGAKCIQIDYRRTGANNDYSNPVVCRVAIFQNNDKMVTMCLSYREKEAGLWKADFEKVFKSFRWLNY